jgi:hypothetical protein
MALAIIGCTIQNTVLAQSTDKSGNQTSAEITGTPESTIVNKTTIPAQQTTVTVNKTTSSTDQSSLQPLQKQQLGNPNMDLSGFENKTVLQPTGEANTTTINKKHLYLLNKQQLKIRPEHHDNNNKVLAVQHLVQANQQIRQEKQFREMLANLEQMLVKEHKT